MPATNTQLEDSERDVREGIRSHWVLFLFQGLVMVILGIVAVAAPMVATLAVEDFAGWLFVIGGIVGLTACSLTYCALWWGLITALLAIAIGVYLIGGPSPECFRLRWPLALISLRRASDADRNCHWASQHAQLVDLVAGQRCRQPLPGRDHLDGLAGHGGMDARPPPWHQSDHVGRVIGHDSARLSRGACRSAGKEGRCVAGPDGVPRDAGASDDDKREYAYGPATVQSPSSGNDITPISAPS